MITEFRSPFLKAVKKIRDPQLKEEISAVILQVEGAPGIKAIASVKKLKGYKDFYRIKVGDYRIGVKITPDIVTFVDIAHRKDIYKQFP